jgi:hypothetical protein
MPARRPASRSSKSCLLTSRTPTVEPYGDVPKPVPIKITVNVVKDVASRFSEGAGPSGTCAADLQNWLLRFGAKSKSLRDSLEGLTEWLANEHPPWATYCALMACHLVALEKSLGVRPARIGEVYRHLMAKCLLKAVGPGSRAPSMPCGRPLPLPPSRPRRPTSQCRLSHPAGRTRWTCHLSPTGPSLLTQVVPSL